MIGATGLGADVMMMLALSRHLLFASSVTVIEYMLRLFVADEVSDICEKEVVVSLFDHLYEGCTASVTAVSVYDVPTHSVSLPELFVIFIFGV